MPSVISILRSSAEYLGEDYVKKAHALYEKYHPIEIEPKISLGEKKKKMEEWWQKHFDFLYKHKIPLIIMSAGGLGSDIISMLFKREARFYPNIYIISNSFIWDKDGKAIGFKEPIIHVANKDETVVKDIPCYKKIKNRRNVLLLGDNPEDTGMIKGFNYKNLIKIGFLNEEVEKNLEGYKKNYDVVILDDSDMNFVNKLIKDLIKQ